MFLGRWFKVLGSWLQRVLGSWFKVLGSWFLGSRLLVSRFLVLSSWYWVYWDHWFVVAPEFLGAPRSGTERGLARVGTRNRLGSRLPAGAELSGHPSLRGTEAPI